MAATAARAAMWSREAVDGLNTLIDFRYQQHFFAKNGRAGMGKDRHGANGADAVLKVPVGTQIYRGRRRDSARRSHRTRPAHSDRQGRQWRVRQRAFQVLDQPRAASRQSRPAGRTANHPIAAQANCRCRHYRSAERRQIDLPRRGERRAGQRSPTIPLPRSRRSSAWWRSTGANSCWPIFLA